VRVIVLGQRRAKPRKERLKLEELLAEYPDAAEASPRGRCLRCCLAPRRLAARGRGGGLQRREGPGTFARRRGRGFRELARTAEAAAEHIERQLTAIA
jgi:hypothetical protein